MQTPGGTGAVRLALALAKKAGVTRVLMGVPSWPNHAQIIADLELELVSFPHATADGSADLDALKAALADAGEGDAVLLHGCCHNPTGIDYSNAQWDEIAALLGASPVLPIVDLAYQGLGSGSRKTPTARARCSPRCRKRSSPTRATRTSASTATASARSTSTRTTASSSRARCRTATRWRARPGRCRPITAPRRCGWC
jgi:DNA-binding transcriptional MocR family regulator